MSINEGIAFDTHLREHPTDWSARLIYADWLEDHDMPEEADRQRRYRESWEWMTELAENCGGGMWEQDGATGMKNKWREITVDDLIRAGRKYLSSDGLDLFTQHGTETLRDHFKPAYWDHWSVLTGVNLDAVKWPTEDGWVSPRVKGNPFACSC